MQNELGMLKAGTYYFKIDGVTNRGVYSQIDTNITNYKANKYLFYGGDVSNNNWVKNGVMLMVWPGWEVYYVFTIYEDQTIDNYIKIRTVDPQ